MYTNPFALTGSWRLPAGPADEQKPPNVTVGLNAENHT